MCHTETTQQQHLQASDSLIDDGSESTSLKTLANGFVPKIHETGIVWQARVC